MASKYDWEFIRPLDQTANISALSQGNQQINAGLQGMGQAITGYADAMKQRNTDEIMNALYQAQTSSDLPNAMQAVQALQQQYGRGYDQTAVRNAIDTRGSTLGQRDLQAINLQQAQAAQAAIPQLNASAIAQAKARGVDTGPLEALAALGIDTTGQINSYTNNSVSDTRYNDESAERKANRAEDVAWRKSQANQAQQNWKADFDYREDQSNWNRGGDIAKENPASNGFAVDGNGNLVTVANPGISRLDAYGALSGVRGIRNNNPGNLNFAGQAGASREGGKGRFASFNTPEEGIGAMSKQLDLHFNGTSVKAKEAGRPLRSVKDIVEAWAPPSENNTAKYVADVAKQLGVSPTANLNLKDPATKTALMKAIVAKENGGNPYTDDQYAAGISGKKATGSSSLHALGNVVPQAVMSKVTSGYQDAMAKLNTDFAAQSAKDQVKGSLATTGKNVDTWAASKKDTGLIFSSNNSFFTKASDLTKMAKADSAFNKLPESAQINVLEGAYAKLNDVNAFQYVPDGDLKKFISRESQNYQKDRINQHEQAKNAVFEQSYQNLVQSFQAAGSRPPSREAARQLFDPQYKAPAPKPAPAQPKPQQQAQPKAPATPAVKQESAMDKQMRERAERKKAEWAVVEKRLAKEKADKEAKAKAEQAKKPVWMGGNAQGNNMFKNVGTGSLTQAQLDKMIKNFNAR